MASSFDRLVGLLSGELDDKIVLDVGTGSGRLALAIAPRCRRVIGIDVDTTALQMARRRAVETGSANVEFRAMDADVDEYTPLDPDVVGAHLCMSDAIIERAGRALARGGILGFVAFHADQWKETGRRSRFAYDEDQAGRALASAGFTVEHFTVDAEVRQFDSVEQGLALAIGMQEKWRADGRWVRYLRFLEDGGRTLTTSHLVCLARRR
jgi:SAM-dependent methyltransferase